MLFFFFFSIFSLFQALKSIPFSLSSAKRRLKELTCPPAKVRYDSIRAIVNEFVRKDDKDIRGNELALAVNDVFPPLSPLCC